jgi:lipid A ethanolaminephosphotransferase
MLRDSLKFPALNNLKLPRFVLLISLLIFLLYHLPFYKYVFQHVNYKSLNGILVIINLMVLMIVVNAFVLYIIFFLSRYAGKFLLIFFFIVNAIALYFINTYHVIVDETMMGNVLNSNYQESSSFFSFKLILYVVGLGIIPAIYVFKVRIIRESWKRFLFIFSVTLVFIALVAYANAPNWRWIDKNSKQLGGLAMPWSYSVNTSLFYIHQHKKNKKEILLPPATITDSEKSVMILVIGESSRKENFSLYGYNKNTNPLLSQTRNLFHFDANSCATYTTAGVKCILEHMKTDDLYEILPNYLCRHNVDVIWRTTNWGEPPVHIKTYQKRENLMADCKGEGCNYDEILLSGLKEQILASNKNKILIILHTSTSHGPNYSKKYPSRFEVFKPVCTSVEPGNCSQEELINAYDNTIVYTDYILHNVIEDLKQLKEYKSAMIFVSDHGESLGEKNLYMHGVPMSFAPKEQYQIPFIVWQSDSTKQLKVNSTLSQNNVFHSVLKFLSIQSPVFDEKMNIFK